MAQDPPVHAHVALLPAQAVAQAPQCATSFWMFCSQPSSERPLQSRQGVPTQALTTHTPVVREFEQVKFACCPVQA